MSRTRVLLPVLVGAVLLAAGCGSAKTTSTSATTTSLRAATTTTMVGLSPATTAGPPTSVAYSTTPVSVAGQGATALLTAVRTAAQNGFDRVTFEFANRLPGYAVDYIARPVLQDGSGTEMVVEGTAVLSVRMTPASGFDLSGGGKATYTGPTRIKAAAPKLVEVVQAGDFEGNLTWVAGVKTKSGFRVSTLESPPRLVVDINSGS
ncbi:MAG: AMIN-like domain-containing (lipo)protein [Acidimicrobiales bacterium]